MKSTIASEWQYGTVGWVRLESAHDRRLGILLDDENGVNQKKILILSESSLKEESYEIQENQIKFFSEQLFSFPFYISAKSVAYLSEFQFEQPIGLMKTSSLSLLVSNVLRLEVRDHTAQYYQKVHKPKQNQTFDRTTSRVPYAGRVFDEKEMLSLMDASLEFWLTSGRFSDEFERNLASILGTKFSFLVNSGSSANLLAFSSLTSARLQERRVCKGDEVITVAAGFPTTIVPSIQNGAVPVFVDISLPTYNIDVSYLEEALSPKTKAIMVAHTLGNPFNLSAVKEFCDKHSLWLIEDNCDALGSRYFWKGRWHYTGTIGDMGTSSFYPPHHITMGEGGAVYTKSALLKGILASVRDWGRDCWCPSGKDNTCNKRFEWSMGELPKGYDHKYTYSHFGYNLKATDLQAAIGCEQLKKISEFGQARRMNWKILREGIADLGELFILPEPTENSDPSWFGFLLTVTNKAGFSRDQIVQFLESRNIQTRMLFAGNFVKHPCFDEMRKNQEGYRQIGDLAQTNLVMESSFWLGVYPGMSESMLSYMIDSIREFVDMSRVRRMMDHGRESIA